MKILKHLILAFVALNMLNCSSDDDTATSSTVMLEEDRNALIEIYNANSNNTLTWDITNTDVATWDCVVVENDRITVLRMSSKNLEVLPATALQKLTELRLLEVPDNTISEIELSNNINLKILNNELENIDLSSNTLLEQVLLEFNNLEDLDVSMLQNLTDLKVNSNNLTGSINIANGNNSDMWRMEVRFNPNLTCVKVDQGATNGFNGWTTPTNWSYSTSCL